MSSGLTGQLAASVRRLRQKAVGAALTLAALTSAVAACTLLVDPDVEQCSTDQDCKARGPLFKDAVCTAKSVCSVPEVVLDGTCKTNKECIELNGGQPAMCRRSDHTCQVLKKGKCDHVIAQPGELESEDVVYLGLTGPMFTGANANDPLWREIFAGVNLAQYELFQNGGIPSSQPGRRNRSVVFVGCDELGSQGDHAATLDHLTKDLEVPALVGPQLSTNFIKDMGTLIPTGHMLISVVASAANLVALDKQGLGYSTSPPDTISAKAIAAYVQNFVEPNLRSSGVVQAGEPVKLLVLEVGNALGTSLRTEFKKNLVLNGKSADENGANYKEINYGDAFDTANNPNPEQKYATAKLDMLAFLPHIVYVAGASEAVANIIAKAEPEWTAPYRPFYLGISQMATGGALYKLMGTDAAFRKRVRVFDVGFATPQPPFALFAGRYEQNPRLTPANPEYVVPKRYAAQAYDAAYLYMYAIAAAKEPLTGASIAEGLKKTQPAAGGPAVEVGPEALPVMLQSLAKGGAIDLNGASGKLDFGPTGHVEADSLVQCAKVGEADGGAGGDAGDLPVVGMQFSGRSYGLQSSTFTGTETCP